MVGAGDFAAAGGPGCVGYSVLVLAVGVLLNLGGGLLVLFTDFVELLHVIEKLCTALESDE